ncbi:anti-sigma factor [Piscinibacter sp. XHJ-5]|uniref:anti-sigma factor family protein n=1 Tax=Piscinibacter sp. XHJ-5 TaxID=3037797 RepID=UPI00245329A0|nr:anti-sigma factor [Piscinibacter sp. XHJ-5]
MNPTAFNELPLDDKLSAWLDDELAADQRAQVEAWLHEHPDDAARVRLWAADRDAVRARLASSIEEAVPTRLEQVAWSQAPSTAHPGWLRWAAVIAAFVVGAAAGAFTMWRLDDDGPSFMAKGGWEQRAMVAHAVYVPEVRHPVEVAVAGKTPEDSKAQEEHLARWLTKRIDRPVKLVDLREQGYELVGGRLLPDAGGPCAQLMYQRIGEATPSRVTVYLRKPDANTPAAFRYERHGELGMFYWIEGSTGYALVGSLPRDQLLTLAEAIYKQVQN